MNAVRLRQVCFAAPELAPAEQLLGEILGVRVVHRAPELNAEFGLENAVFAVNGSFIEIVAPLRQDSAVARFLRAGRRQALYIVIVDCTDLQRHRRQAQHMGIRIAHEAVYPNARNIQLHPADMGWVMLEIDQHAKGREPRFGHFEWAGTGWHMHVRTDVTVDLMAVELAASNALPQAERWAGVLGRVAQRIPGGARIALDYGALCFRDAHERDGPGDGATVVQLSVRDPAEVLAHADHLGCRTVADAFEFCGVWLRLVAAPAQPSAPVERRSG